MSNTTQRDEDNRKTMPDQNDNQLNAYGQPLGHPVEGWIAPAPVQTAALTKQFYGNHCQLELLQDHHAAELHAAFAHVSPSLWTYLPYGPFKTLDDYEQLIVDLNQDDRKQCFTYCIKSAEGDQTLGFCAYLRMAPQFGSIEIGHISFSPLLQKTTAATETLFMLIDAAFMLGYRRVEWKCNDLNAPSIAAAKRFGFQYEGTFRQAQVVKERNRNTAWFSILDHEWEKLRECYDVWLSEDNFDEAGKQKLSLSTLTREVRESFDK